jgi:hypothetical protein
MKSREIWVTGDYGTAVIAEPCVGCGGSTNTPDVRYLVQLEVHPENGMVMRQVAACSDVCERKAAGE